jgi:hypothetical protein
MPRATPKAYGTKADVSVFRMPASAHTATVSGRAKTENLNPWSPVLDMSSSTMGLAPDRPGLGGGYQML